MPTLEELARVLGGAIRTTRNLLWLDTEVGDLRAVVILRDAPLTSTTTYVLAVFTPGARAEDLFDQRSDWRWRLDGVDDVTPRLPYDYVFAGCRGGCGILPSGHASRGDHSWQMM